MTDVQSVVDSHSTIPDEAIRDAAKSIRVAQGRERFSFDNLLPSDLATAVELVMEVLPADALTSVLTLPLRLQRPDEESNSKGPHLRSDRASSRRRRRRGSTGC